MCLDKLISLPVSFILRGSLDVGCFLSDFDSERQLMTRYSLRVEHIGTAVHVDYSLRYSVHLKRQQNVTLAWCSCDMRKK